MSPAWLDVMPAIPLARAVPCFDPDDGEKYICLGPPEMTRTSQTDGALALHVALQFVDNDEGWMHHDACFMPVADLRADLDDPQGFAYAFAWRWREVPVRLRFAGEKADSFALKGNTASALARMLNGETTDADRLALAKACAEVLP